MKLKCINIGANKSLTLNKDYELVNEKENRYSIINDKGIQANYSKNLFKKEEIVKIPEIEEINVSTSVKECDDEELLVDIKVSFDNISTFNVQSSALKIHTSEINCGIGEVEGINDLMSFLNQTKKGLENFIGESERKGKFIITDEQKSNIKNDFMSGLSECVIDDIIHNLSRDYGAALASTNTENNNNINQEFIEALEKRSSNLLHFKNINSGNDCVLFELTLHEI